MSSGPLLAVGLGVVLLTAGCLGIQARPDADSQNRTAGNAAGGPTISVTAR